MDFGFPLVTRAADVKFYNRETIELHKGAAVPFIPAKCYETGRIVYYNLVDDSSMLLGNRFDRAFASSNVKDPRTGVILPKWKTIDLKLDRKPHFGYKELSSKTKFYQKPEASARYKNADTRLSYLLDDCCFLTNAFFTFGLSQPKEGEVHIVKTYGVPLLYYVLREGTPAAERLRSQSFPEGFFSASYQPLFDAYVLPEDTTFVIPSKTIYVLLTVQKTMFIFYNCKASLIRELRFGKESIRFSQPDNANNRLFYDHQKKAALKRQSALEKSRKRIKTDRLDDLIQFNEPEKQEESLPLPVTEEEESLPLLVTEEPLTDESSQLPVLEPSSALEEQCRMDRQMIDLISRYLQIPSTVNYSFINSESETSTAIPSETSTAAPSETHLTEISFGDIDQYMEELYASFDNPAAIATAAGYEDSAAVTYPDESDRSEMPTFVVIK